MDRRIALVLILASCKDPPPPAPKVDAAAPALATPPSFDGKKIVENACLSCHRDDMLQQQRLTKAQWEKTVTKMAGWGANLEESEKPALVAYLADRYGPDAGPFVPESAPPSALEPTNDDVAGDAEAGRAKYVDKCSGCHGEAALGHIGVRLADRPIIHRFGDVEELVRRGKGKMPPAVIERKDLADILAHLRTLRPSAP